MSAIVLYRIDDAKRMHRYYRMDVQPDLFGEWCLMREWGRIGRAGQLRSVPYPTPVEAEAALQRQCRIKQRRGYLF
jgi:predicted DNA-binding WGR domain protein